MACDNLAHSFAGKDTLNVDTTHHGALWTDVYTPLRILVRSILILLLLVFATIPTILSMTRPLAAIRIGRRHLDEVMVAWWTGMICRIFGVRVQARGSALRGPVLIVANHISWLDIFALHSQAMMGFLSKAEVASYPLIGFMATMSGTVFHERGSHSSSSDVATAMVRRLNEGRRVAIFPEGGIRPGDEVKIFHARLFKVAIETGCPVQPVMLRYIRKGKRCTGISFTLNEPFMHNFVRLLGRPSCTCDLRFLAPLEASGRARKDVAKEARDAIRLEFEAPVGGSGH